MLKTLRTTELVKSEVITLEPAALALPILALTSLFVIPPATCLSQASCIKTYSLVTVNAPGLKVTVETCVTLVRSNVIAEPI